jgi:hypothetical protein
MGGSFLDILCMDDPTEWELRVVGPHTHGRGACPPREHAYRPVGARGRLAESCTGAIDQGILLSSEPNVAESGGAGHKKTPPVVWVRSL